MSKNQFVEFELFGGFFQTSHLRDSNGHKLYTTVEDARKAGISEKDIETKVVRWSDGTPVGKIEMSLTRKRLWKVPVSETAIIEGMAYHELCDSPQKHVSLPKVVMRDMTKIDEEKIAKRELRNKLNTIYANLKDAEIEDIASLMGWHSDVANEKLETLKDSDSGKFLSLFNEPFLKGKIYTASLKEESIIGAVLKRAIMAKVVDVKAGAISFEDVIIGTDFSKAVMNLMDTTKGGKANLIPLIKAKMNEK